MRTSFFPYIIAFIFNWSLVFAYEKTALENHPFYIIGCSKTVVNKALVDNMRLLLRNLNKVTFIIFGPDEVMKSDFKSLPIGTIVHLPELDNGSRYRTKRIDKCRNSLLQWVHEDVNAQRYWSQDPYVIMIDFDEVNEHPFNISSYDYVMNHPEDWDVVTFNRPSYYDLWALRYERINYNVMNFGNTAEDGRWSGLVLSKDIYHQLKNYPGLYYPVMSAFNGVAIFKHYLSEQCRFDWWNAEPYSRNSGVEEECEHVKFFKCMTEKTHRTFIYKYYLSLSNHA